MSKEEIWRSVPGFPNVEASSTGRVRTIAHTITVTAPRKPAHTMTFPGRILKQWSIKGRCTTGVKNLSAISVGRLVCLAFHGEPPPGKPNALHRDDDSWNNVPDNLYWGNQRQNAIDAQLSERQRGELARTAKLTESQAREIKMRLRAGEKGFLLAREFGMSETAIHDIKTGRTWKHLKID